MVDVTTANLAAEAGKKTNEVGAALTVVSDTTSLAAKANAINTTGKYEGKQVFNRTTGILVIAAGPANTDVWKNAGTGATAHTPT